MAATVGATLLTLLPTACSDQVSDDRVRVVSVVNLIATPDAFDNQWISVQGIASIKDDGSALFLSADDALYGNLSNAIWLVRPESAAWSSMHGKWVGVRGVFDADSQGRSGLFAGEIHDIDRFEPITAVSRGDQ